MNGDPLSMIGSQLVFVAQDEGRLGDVCDLEMFSKLLNLLLASKVKNSQEEQSVKVLLRDSFPLCPTVTSRDSGDG